ncbi:hypothetical protein [Mycobacterium sp.]|jgi:hypothetical protein|uniref:hypothetical protein n=1 Tax=Mycobacterium sp. TaxID=1785 RepID=UPI002BC89C3A|nr:hypothetical protein [Mycobacterium sp.]HTH89490.1 hypothetical protein [Mycobacterium sp.]
MSELRAPFGAESGAVEESGAALPRNPVLITEQRVLFATAAAMPLQPAKSARRWAVEARAIRARLRATFATFSNEARPKRRRYPSGNDFLEDSRMAREMLGL